MDYSNKENVPGIENKNFQENIPNLKLKNSQRNSLSPENLSYSSRMKKRSQVDRSLDLCLIKCINKTPKIIKASHEIVTPLYPSPLTRRKTIFGEGIIINNRKVSKNIFLDQVRTERIF